MIELAFAKELVMSKGAFSVTPPFKTLYLGIIKLWHIHIQGLMNYPKDLQALHTFMSNE